MDDATPVFGQFFPSVETAEYAERALMRLYEETEKVRGAGHPLGFRASAWQLACWAAEVKYPASEESEEQRVSAAWKSQFMFGLVTSDAVGCAGPCEPVFDVGRTGFHEKYYITDVGRRYCTSLK